MTDRALAEIAVGTVVEMLEHFEAARRELI